MHWLTYFFVIMFLFFIILVLALSFPIALLVTPPKAGYSKKQFWKTYLITSLVIFILGFLLLLLTFHKYFRFT